MSKFSNLEFHRSGIGVLVDPNDSDPGAAIYLENAAGSTRPLRFCSCTVGRRRTCRHLSELSRQIKIFRKLYSGRAFGEVFAASSWARLAQFLFEGDAAPFAETRVAQINRGGRPILRFSSASGRTLVDYLEISPAALRFLERTAKVPAGNGFLDRAELIEKLSVFLRTSEEQHLNRVGMKTNRQSFEESLWYRLAYHCFRELDDGEDGFGVAINRNSGVFTATWARADGRPLLRFSLPRTRVPSFLGVLREISESSDVAPATLESILGTYEPEPDGGGWIERVRALLEWEDGRSPGPEVEKYLYGNLAWLPELGILAELEGPEGPPPIAKHRPPTRIVAFDDPPDDADPKPRGVLEDPTRDLAILSEFDFVEIAADEGVGEELDVRYAYGDDKVTIRQILEAKRQGLSYLETRGGWIDLGAPELRGIETFMTDSEPEGRDTGDGIVLSSAQLLRLKSSTSKPVRVEGSQDRSAILERLLEFRPSQPLAKLHGLTSELRPYQKLGVEWLHFLYENRLAGLLCDDMGLGKTHQAMALMVLVREQHGVEDPILVVCPRTVISHWRDKLQRFAPGVTATVYHGSQRDLDVSLDEADVLIASYGVLRNDIAKLSRHRWGLVFFDEVQQIKNHETQAYRAAIALPGRMKIGLTGTPIENSLVELKNLFDLVLPGYLGNDDDYFDRYGASPRDEPDEEQISELRRLISPFVLRRLKRSVLHELPEKIEDIRTCTLGDEQRSLYRQTINTRGLVLADKIRSGGEPLPYIHIFALLNQLKQICDHPALALGEAEKWRKHDSGKWDLFVDLLEESLASDQKVVVFSQYLGMIAIMQDYLETRGVGFTKLTGSTRKRGAVVDTFNEDPACRVFLGSLRAGGTGIDLIGGSVVIHYDRWWNAAKEDQATDRVYRIGQKRAVQVFKLVTEDTLEERIAAMIDRKRKLMSTVVQADHPKLGKIFTREELLELLEQIED